MSDVKKEMGDEYHYPADEYVVEPVVVEHVEEAVEETSKPAAVRPAWKELVYANRRKLMIVGILVILLVSFQIMRSHRADTPQALPTEQPQQPVQTQFQPVVADQTEIQRSLASIQQDSDSSNQEIVNLKNQLETMRGQMQEADETNNQLKQAMMLLLQELRNVHETMNANNGDKKSGLPKPKLVYAARAIVDGRAWILGSNGLAQSVTIGDPIPGYGLVTGIYPARGVITTTTGKEIRLGSNDY